MIKIENTKVTGWDVAIRGMRNPKNSWKHSDTKYIKSHLCTSDYEVALAEVCGGTAPLIGPNDLKLMMTLVKAGTDHRKFMRFIKVTVHNSSAVLVERIRHIQSRHNCKFMLYYA